jgi:hypothetical protein
MPRSLLLLEKLQLSEELRRLRAAAEKLENLSSALCGVVLTFNVLSVRIYIANQNRWG